MDVASIPTTEVTPNARAERALRLFEERGHLIRSTASDTFEVPSCGMVGKRYTVRYGGAVEESCSCPDFQFGHVCKHLLCVGIAHARRRGGVRVISTPAVAAGDPFKAAARHRGENLAALEEKYRHEIMDDEERQELRDRVIRARQSL